MLIDSLIDFWWLLVRFFAALASKLGGPGSQKPIKTNCFLMILLFQPSCQQEAIWSISGSTWPPTWPPKPSRIRPKMVPKPIKNQAKYKSNLYINFKLIFYRFLSVLTPKWTPIWWYFCALFGNFFGLAGSWGQDGPQTSRGKYSHLSNVCDCLGGSWGGLGAKMAPRPCEPWCRIS